VAKRKDALKIETKDDALDCMLSLADIATAMAQSIAKRDAAIAAINDQYAEALDVQSKNVALYKDALGMWAQANEKTHADPDTRTITFAGVGSIQLRTGNPTVSLKRGVKEEDAIRMLFDAGLGVYVRTVLQLNREAIIADRENETQMTAAKDCGVSVRQGESALFDMDGIGRV
jgi:phage host-nuclease inhibitor protein Gam